MKTGLFITFGASLAGNALATIAIGHIEAFNGRTYSGMATEFAHIFNNV